MMLPKIVLRNFFLTVWKSIFLLFMPFYAVVRSKDNKLLKKCRLTKPKIAKKQLLKDNFGKHHHNQHNCSTLLNSQKLTKKAKNLLYLTAGRRKRSREKGMVAWPMHMFIGLLSNEDTLSIELVDEHPISVWPQIDQKKELSRRDDEKKKKMQLKRDKTAKTASLFQTSPFINCTYHDSPVYILRKSPTKLTWNIIYFLPYWYWKSRWNILFPMREISISSNKQKLTVIWLLWHAQMAIKR
jgi:hypothetical protein